MNKYRIFPLLAMVSLYSLLGVYRVTAQNAPLQSLAKEGRSLEEIVPKDWYTSHATGDMNKDGIPDIALVTQPQDKSKIELGEDGFEYDYNPNILAIYFGTQDGVYKLHRAYLGVIPARVDEYTGNIFSDIKINGKGILIIDTSEFAMGAASGNASATFLLRYQSRQFHLIGMEAYDRHRTAGENIMSVNYLTSKKCTTTDDFQGNRKEKWEDIKEKKLRPLGTFYFSSLGPIDFDPKTVDDVMELK